MLGEPEGIIPDETKPLEGPDQPPILTGEVERAEADAALKEEFPAAAPAGLPPLVVPRRLIASMRPERLVTIKAPGKWSEIELTFWINPSDLEVQAVAKSKPMLTNFLAHFLRGWNLMYEEERDAQGNVIRPSEPVPVNNDELGELSADLISWFGDEYRVQRLHPLPSESALTSSVVRESRLTGGGLSKSRNGSG